MTLFELRADYIRRTMVAMEKKGAIGRKLKADKYEYESQRNIDVVEYSRLGALVSAYETITQDLECLSF